MREKYNYRDRQTRRAEKLHDRDKNISSKNVFTGKIIVKFSVRKTIDYKC